MMRRWLGISVLCLSALAAGAQAQPPSQGAAFLDRLHNDLQLSPAQQSAWQTFEQASRPDPQEMAQAEDAQGRMASMTGPQRMDMAITMAQQNLAALRRRGDALKTFYAQLSPQQQRVFDRDTAPPPGGGMNR